MSIPLLDDAVGVAYPIAVTIAGLGGAALAIVVCTVALRTLLLPLTLASIRGERARASVAPGVQELQRKHAKDPARLRQELTALYREAGVSPYAGLFPAFLQAPFFLVIYRLFVSPTIGGQANALLHNTFLGVGLSAHLVAAPLVFLPFLVILAILGWLTVRRNGIRGLAAALPFGTVVAAAFVPLAAVLYLVASTAWTGTVEVWLRRRALA
jgi:YidC/Oxa1 family membrane protein insertase